MATNRISKPTRSNTALFVCDLQEDLESKIQYFSEIVKISRRVIDAARILKILIIVSDQEENGSTVDDVYDGLDDDSVNYQRTQFSMLTPEAEKRIKSLKQLENVILIGTEAHVSILQTSLDLLERGYKVHVVVDAVSSRSHNDRHFAFKQMEQAGAILTTSEAVILGLVGGSDHPEFEEIKDIIRRSPPDTGLVPSPRPMNPDAEFL